MGATANPHVAGGGDGGEDAGGGELEDLHILAGEPLAKVLHGVEQCAGRGC
jgi:hypothetical protein